MTLSMFMPLSELSIYYASTMASYIGSQMRVAPRLFRAGGELEREEEEEEGRETGSERG